MSALENLVYNPKLFRFLNSVDTLLVDVAKAVPFVKGFIDKENYTPDEIVMDVMETIIIASALQPYAPRLVIDQVLLAGAMGSRLYSEVSKDFEEGFEKIGLYLDQKFGDNKFYNGLKNYFRAADTVIKDKFTIPAVLSGWVVADSFLLLGVGQENVNNPINSSSLQHLLATYGGSNLLMRMQEEHHFEKYGERIQRKNIAPWGYLALMALVLGGWEEYERVKFNFGATADRDGDIGVGGAGWMGAMIKSPEEIMQTVRFYNLWIKTAHENKPYLPRPIRGS